MQLENPWEEGPSFELWFLVLHEAVHTAYVCGEKLKTHRRRKEGFGLTNHSSWQVLSAHKQPLPINLWHPARIGVSILVDSWKYCSLVPVLMAGFMDWICKSCWMASDLLLKHNGLWVCLLKMLINLILLFFFFHSHLCREDSAGNAGHELEHRSSVVHVLYVWWHRQSCLYTSDLYCPEVLLLHFLN